MRYYCNIDIAVPLRFGAHEDNCTPATLRQTATPRTLRATIAYQITDLALVAFIGRSRLPLKHALR
jgi:hypothetical protein